jgi:hypothetical protein
MWTQQIHHHDGSARVWRGVIKLKVTGSLGLDRGDGCPIVWIFIELQEPLFHSVCEETGGHFSFWSLYMYSGNAASFSRLDCLSLLSS